MEKDTLNNLKEHIEILLDMSDSAEFLFNVEEDNSNSAKMLTCFLKDNVKNNTIGIVNKEELINKTSELPKISIVDCANLSSVDMGIISSQTHKFKKSKSLIVFNISKTQHFNIHNFEPFHFRIRMFHELTDELIKYKEFSDLNKSINVTNSVKKNKI